jgi:peptide/nickel transport system substrate-binding protein
MKGRRLHWSLVLTALLTLALLLTACPQEQPAVTTPATPAPEAPAAEEPAATEPATEEPAAEEPAATEPAATEAPAEEPAAEETATPEPAAEEPAPTADGCGFDIVIGSNGDGRIVNPILAVDTDGFWRTDMMFDSLIDLDPTTLEPVPHLAESWEVSDDALTYTFNLTDADVRWHDGEPFTVEDIEYTLMEILKPTYTGIYQARFADLVGADAVIAGEAESLEGFQIVDEDTVQFQLNNPNAAFLATAINDLKFLPKHLLEGQEITEDMAYSGAPIGTGPYKFSRWDRGSEFVLEWNEDYWGEQPCARTITTVVIPDMQSLAAAIEAGDIDLTITVPPTEIARLSEVSGLEVYSQPSVGPETLWFNLDHPILQNPQVRQAIAHAIDAEAFTENVLQGTTEPANGPVSNAVWAFDPAAELPEYDPDRARELLAEAGYADGFDIRVSTNQGNFFRELFVEFLQAELAQVGINVQVDKAEWGTFIGGVMEGNYEMRFHNQDAGVPDPDSIHPVFHSEGGANWSGYSNPEVDRLLDEARQSTDLEARRAAYAEAVELINADLVGFNAFWRPNNLVTKERYEGVVPSALYNYGSVHQWRLRD